MSKIYFRKKISPFLRELWKENSDILSLYGFMLGVSIILLLYMEKGDALLLAQSNHSPIQDLLLEELTRLGGSGPYLVLGVASLFFSLRQGIFVGVTGLMVSAVVFVLKDYFGYPRPVVFFDWLGESQFRAIEGVYLARSFNSFPSGHTTAAFALFFFLAFVYSSHRIKYLCLITAMTVGFSRMYLGKHFLEDVMFGSVLGLSLAAISAYIYYCGPSFGTWESRHIPLPWRIADREIVE